MYHAFACIAELSECTVLCFVYRADSSGNKNHRKATILFRKKYLNTGHYYESDAGGLVTGSIMIAKY